MDRIKAFTLLELLTVIAIIAILAAITFPVYMRVKDSANRSSDTAHLGELSAALALYKVDQGGYPPQILGYATLYAAGPDMGNLVPAESAINFLYPRRISSFETLKPRLDTEKDSVYTRAVWPHQDSRPVASAPYLDLNGDGSVDGNPYPASGNIDYGSDASKCYEPDREYFDDDFCARQAFSPSVSVTRYLPYADYQYALSQNQNPLVGGETAPGSGETITMPAYFYNIDGYEVATVRDGPAVSDTRTELHYALFWSNWGLGWAAAQADATIPPAGNTFYSGGGDGHDDPRQLGYADPPDSTVITWDSFFRNYDDQGEPTRDRRDIVLFVGGGALAKDSKDVNDRSWRITP